MEKLEKNLNVLKTLSCCKRKKRISIIKNGKRDLIKSIDECILNTLNGNVQLDKKVKDKLKRYKYSLRKILRKKKLKDKKNILIQEGGFLSTLLPTAIVIITSLLDKLKK